VPWPSTNPKRGSERRHWSWSPSPLPRRSPRERAELTIDPSGTVELVLGTMSAGQGHETSFAQVIAEWLGVEPERVRLVTDDTDRVQAGGGSASARSMRLGSWVIAKVADEGG